MTARCNSMWCKHGRGVLARLMLVACVLGVFFLREAVALEVDAPAPSARVGQLSLTSSNVRMRVERMSAWEQAVLNMPMTTGSALATQIPGRTEVRIGSTALRLGQESQVVWTEISDTRLHLEMINGLFSLRVRVLAPGESVQLKAGAVSVQVLKPGAYLFRFVTDRANLRVWVLEGQARVALREQNLTLDTGQQIQVDRGISTQLSSSADEHHASFVAFAEGRDRRTESSLALMHVSREVTGAEDLDGHGNWRDEAGYGAVWFPNKLPPDWAPYRFGRWRWLAPWGWTWIDDAPWGFAPFHYGRWLFAGGRWGWVPSHPSAASAQSRPVYAPALVGFFGNQTGAVWSASVASEPVVGWYPLAPGEIYWPAYSTQMAYVRALNAASVSDVGQIQAVPAATAVGQPHRYSRTAFAASVIPFSAFSRMQGVAGSQIVLSPAALAQASLFGRRLPPPPPINAP
ncbi:MAG: hypothetical protein EAZ30_14455 [Betaproteobacteria bacterium]|nr:MAG: hypothetical protein EAZ30_14455 [Betaproteobacteria bacterium]